MYRLWIMNIPIFASLLLWVGSASAMTIDMTSGTSGTVSFNQSFNETRGVDINILGSSLIVSSMTLNVFDINTSTGAVGARIYNNDGSLRASANVNVSSGADQSVSIPISSLLYGGSTYRLGFFIDVGSNGGAADLFDPNPPGYSVTPYTDSTGTVQVTGAFADPNDVYPTTSNTSMPYMTMEAKTVPEPATGVLLASGIVGLMVFRKRRHIA